MKKHWLTLGLIVFIAAFLRLYNLDQNPPSLYWDEASLGYNAYAILTTGHDEHGEYLPLARFIAFGDYKPPGYIYAIVPAMAVFGVNEFAIRFPSALSGILMVLLTYFLATKLIKNTWVGIVSAALLAVSPWSLQLSRGAFEAHLAALFHLVAVILFLLATKKHWLFPLSFAGFMLSFYTFNANRILAPLFIILLGIIYFREVWQAKKWLIISILIAGLFLVPSISYLQSRESKLRFYEVSIFTSLDTVKKANERIARAGNTWWARVIHNRRIYFAREFMSHYLDNFKGEFLFISGDRNPRLSIQDTGELYLFELPFLVVGLLTVLRWKNKTATLIFGWLLLSPVPAATARETPHMLRTASILPSFQIFTAIGMMMTWRWLRVSQIRLIRPISLVMFAVVVAGSLVYYFHNYWMHYPRDWSGEWQYGYRQLVEKVKRMEPNYDRIVITANWGRPYIYFLLYNQVDPLEYVQIRRADRDWYGLWNVYGFGKYDFGGGNSGSGKKTLLVTTKGGIADPQKITDKVYAPDGTVVYEIGEK